MGFKDISKPMPYLDCVNYLKAHMNEVDFESDEPHYAETLDIMNAETGRLMSYIL